MHKYWTVLATCALSLPFAAAAQNRDGPAEGQRSEHEQHAQAAGETAPNGQSTAAMHEHMQAMREQMARIHAAQDTEERQRLMHEHMQSMQQHMQMMGRMGQEPDAAPGTSRCTEGDMACRMQEMQAQNGMMQQRMRTMQDRMESMQQLMREMMDHLRENEAQDTDDRRERRR
jgi:hypothetical protein